MLGEKDPQGRFFDRYVYENHIPRDHELVRMDQEVDFSFVEEETRDLYEEEMGRPSWPPGVLFRMLFLEYYSHLSDVQVSEQCVYNLLYRWFVGLGVGEGTPDDTTLVVFRRRLGPERMERFFKRINEQAKGKYTEETDQIIGEMEGMFYGEEKVVSLVDSDARWGYKPACRRQAFCGYKVHVGCDESETVTSVELLSGNENEGRGRVFVSEDYQLKLLDENPEQEVT